jgi:predicted DNA-binding protein
MSFFKRVFSRQRPENVTKSIRCPLVMWEALESLADEVGETANGYIVLILDQYLQVQLENGKLKPPASDEKQTAS